MKKTLWGYIRACFGLTFSGCAVSDGTEAAPEPRQIRRGALDAPRTAVKSAAIAAKLPPGEYLLGATEFAKYTDGSIRIALNSDEMGTAWRLLEVFPEAELVLNDYCDFRGQDLDFLRDHPELKRLDLFCRRLPKQGMSALRDLESLAVSGENADIDLGMFPRLRSFRGQLPARALLPDALPELRQLTLWNYPGRDLCELPNLQNLRSLQLNQCTLRSLAGCGRFPELREVAVAHCRRLADAAELPEIKLQWLSVVSCAKLDALYELLTAQTELIGLELEGSLELPDLKFLAGMPHLGYLWMLVKNISDGDLRLCRDIPIVNFRDRKHYRPRLRELPPLDPRHEPSCHSGTTLENLAVRLGVTLDTDRRELAALSDRYFKHSNNGHQQ